MEKKTLYALIAVVVLGAGAFAVMRAPEKGQRVGPPPRPIPAFKAADVAAIDLVTEKQEKISLGKAPAPDGSWRVKAPGDWPADAAAVKSLLDGLERLAFGDQVTQGKEKHEDLGVADGKAQRVTVKNASGTTLADFFVGKAVAGYTMVRLAGKNEVWQGSGIYGYMVNRDAKGWRDHVIFQVSAPDAEKLVVEAGASKLALEKLPGDKDVKVGGEAKWKIVEATGDAPKTTEALDVQHVNGAVQALAALRATDFADDTKKPDDVGLAKPAMTVTLTAKGKPYALLIGAAQGEDIYVKAADQPTIYTVKKFALERVAHKPVDYRDKTLVKVKEVDLQGVDITVAGETTSIERAKGDKWQARGGKLALDEAKVKPVMSAFEAVAGSGFSDEKEPAKTGLAKPAGLVALHLKDKSTVTLKVGAATADKADYYVQKVGSPDVLLVKKYAVDRFLKKPAELKK
jgi:hypothetical protein